MSSLLLLLLFILILITFFFQIHLGWNSIRDLRGCVVGLPRGNINSIDIALANSNRGNVRETRKPLGKKQQKDDNIFLTTTFEKRQIWYSFFLSSSYIIYTNGSYVWNNKFYSQISVRSGGMDNGQQFVCVQ